MEEQYKVFFQRCHEEMKYLSNVWNSSNNIHCLCHKERSLCLYLSHSLQTSEQSRLYTHSYRGRCWKKMRGWFCKVTTTQQVSGIKCSVYRLPVLPLGKKKNNLLLINTGHLVACLATRQLAQPFLTDLTLLCIWCFLGWRMSFSCTRRMVW